MPQLTLDMKAEELKDLIFQLPPQDLFRLVEEIEERAETVAMMRLSETAFEEWNEAGFKSVWEACRRT